MSVWKTTCTAQAYSNRNTWLKATTEIANELKTTGEKLGPAQDTHSLCDTCKTQDISQDNAIVYLQSIMTSIPDLGSGDTEGARTKI